MPLPSGWTVDENQPQLPSGWSIDTEQSAPTTFREKQRALGQSKEWKSATPSQKQMMMAQLLDEEAKAQGAEGGYTSAQQKAQYQPESVAKQIVRKGLKYGAATVGGVLGGTSGTLATAGVGAVPATLAGAMGGYGLGTAASEALLGPEPVAPPPERIMKGEGLKGVIAEGVYNVPKSAANLAEMTLAMPSELAKATMTQGGGEQTAKGMVHFMGAPLGIYGQEEMARAYALDPVGTMAALKGNYEIAKGVTAKPIEVTRDISTRLRPSSWEPSGMPTKKAGISETDSVQQSLNRTQAKAPKVIENRITNSSESLIPPGRESADPAVRAANTEKMKIGVDNFEQLAKEGTINEHDANGNIVLDAEGAPKPYTVGKGGIVAAVKPAMQALDSIWNEVKGALNRSTINGVRIPTKGVAGLEDFGGRDITPNELQGKISELNEVLYKTKDGVLSLEDTMKRNTMKRAVGELNTILDGVVDTGLSELGLRDLHAQWGGMRHFTDAILNGAEQQIEGWTKLSPMDVPAHGGVGYKAVGFTTRAMKKLFKNPDHAFENLIRARRAQGNKVRERYTDLTQDMPPEPFTQFDPTVGARTNIQGEGAMTGKGLPAFTEGPQGQTLPMTGRGLPAFTEGPQGQTLPMTGKGLPPSTRTLNPDFSVPREVPPGELVSPEAQAFGTSVIGKSEAPVTIKRSSAGGMDLPLSTKESAQAITTQQLKSQIESLKQQIKDIGGGKKGTATVAAMLGISVPLLTQFILGDDKKRKEMLIQYPQLGGL